MKDESVFTHVLFHDDLTGLPVGDSVDGFRVIARGLGKYVECSAPPESGDPSIRLIGQDAWRDYRFRAVVTPVSFEHTNPVGVFCGIVARYKNSHDYIALILDRDDRVKLLRRTANGFDLLASATLEFCIGQSLSLTLTVVGNDIVGTAGPYTGKTTVRATVDGTSSGRVGFISTTFSRFGPHTVECEPDEAAHLAKSADDADATLKKKRMTFPQMKRERTVPLRGLATGSNIEFADLNGDGKLEILVGQSSSSVAEKISLTRLTCLTALTFDGAVMWQAGVPDVAGIESTTSGELPFRYHDLFGDGHPVVVCVFGYDIQIRHAKTGKMMMSAQTPSTSSVSDEFKAVVGRGSRFGDETLNMDVARISFCDTQGNGAKKEIVVTDAYNLAVLDPLAEPTLYPIFKHRGDLRGGIFVGDIDSDGKDEILAGSSLINDDGSLIKTVRCAAQSRSVSSLEDNPNRVVCASDDGLWHMDASVSNLRAQRLAGGCFSNVYAGKFRAEFAGNQYAATGGDGVTFFDTNFHSIGTRPSTLLMPMSGSRVVKWTGKTEALLLISMEKGGGLIDGRGDLVVPIPDNCARYVNCKVLPGYCADGRDAIAAWNNDELAFFVPEN
ncbi:MAG: hypothetical protein WCT04_02025 [Planctomycetota bacterium]